MTSDFESIFGIATTGDTSDTPLAKETEVIEYPADILLLRSLVSDLSRKDENALFARGLSTRIFSDTVAVYAQDLFEHKQRYGKFPNLETLRLQNARLAEFLSAVPAYNVSPHELYDLAVTARVKADVRKSIGDISAAIEDANAIDALRLVEQRITQLTTRYSKFRTNAKTFSELADDLAADYEQLKNPILSGHPLPVGCLRDAMRVLEPAQITTIVAKSGVGKSWLEIMLSDAIIHGDPYRMDFPVGGEPYTLEQKAKSQGKVLFVTIEMSVLDMARRHAAISGKLSFNRLRAGKLSEQEEYLYAKFLESLKAEPEDLSNVNFLSQKDNTRTEPLNIGNLLKFVGADTASTPAEIHALAEEFGASVVIIDGFYMMHGAGEKRWEKVQDNMGQIRMNSLRSSDHYILTSQLDRQSSGANAGLDNLAFSASIGHDTNNLVVLSQSKAQRAAKQIQFHLAKARDAEIKEPCLVNWDFINMNFTEVGYLIENSGNNFTTPSTPSIFSTL